MATQRIRYVGRHTAGIEIPVDRERSAEIHVAHHGIGEVEDSLARELIKRGDFNAVDDDSKTKTKKDD